MLRGPQGLSALHEKRRQIRVLEEENANLSRDIENKKKRIDRLEHDPKALDEGVSIRVRTSQAADHEIPGVLGDGIWLRLPDDFTDIRERALEQVRIPGAMGDLVRKALKLG